MSCQTENVIGIINRIQLEILELENTKTEMKNSLKGLEGRFEHKQLVNLKIGQLWLSTSRKISKKE